MPRLFAPCLALVAALVLVTQAALAAPPERPKTHVVYAGQRLGSIAKRYNVSIEALCTANGIRERDPIRPGQRLVIPAPSDKDGTEALEQRLAREGTTARAAGPTKKSAKEPATSWNQYKKQPRRKGYVEILTHTKRWRGLVVDVKGRIRPPARKAIAALLDATDPHPKLPDGLIHLLVRVSDTFGGRPLRVVSGFRTTSYFRDSRHRTSEAVDFSVVGVPNAAVRDYLVTLGKVGVGYYPNSTFLHLDVRLKPTYWVDYSGPGEAPRRMARRSSTPAPMDLDDRAEEAAESGGTLPEAAHDGSDAPPGSAPQSASASATDGETKTGSLPTRPATSP